MKAILSIFLVLSSMLCHGQSIFYGASPAPTVVYPPDFVTLVVLTNETTSLGTTTFIIPASGIPQNSRIGVIGVTQSSPMGLASIADNHSNPYSVYDSISGQCGDNMSFGQGSGNATTALAAGDTVTITWAAAISTPRIAALVYMTNCATSGQPDKHVATAACPNSSAAVTAPGSTTAANTIQFGALLIQDGATTYSGGNWTTIGSVDVYNSVSLYLFYHKSSSSGSQDPGGTLSGLKNWAFAWSGYK